MSTTESARVLQLRQRFKTAKLEEEEAFTYLHQIETLRGKDSVEAVDAAFYAYECAGYSTAVSQQLKEAIESADPVLINGERKDLPT